MRKIDSRMLETSGADMPTDSDNNTAGILYKYLTVEEFDTLCRFMDLMNRLSTWARSKEEGV